MKIACLIQSKPPLRYFVNHINDAHKISLVVVESPPERYSKWELIKKKGFIGTIVSIKNKLSSKASYQQTEAVLKKYFGNEWQKISEDIPILYVNSINDKSVQDALEKLKPDLILDHGTSIVKNHILDTASLALNLHWGLSPYYRGVSCTEWGILNWDPYNIGVTIHKLAREIDGGDIVAQKRATITKDDTVFSIDMQLTSLGIDLLLKIIMKLNAGEELKFHRQEFGSGYITYNRQWSRYLSYQIEMIEKNKMLRRILKYPSRKEKLPIIDFE